MKKYIALVRVPKPDSAGNTYHDVSLYDCATMELAAERIKAYGYGRACECTAMEMILELNPRLENKYRSTGYAPTRIVRQAINDGQVKVIYHLI